MKLFSKRRTQEEDIGRRRPLRAEQGQSRVFSYYANRSASETNLGRGGSQDEPPKRHSSMYVRVMRRLPLLSAGVLVVGIFISQMILVPNPKIVILTSSGASGLFLQNTKVYQTEADKLFGQSLGNQNKLTLDASGISAKLKAMFPELSDVSVTFPLLGSQPVVYLQPSEPTFVLSANGESYVLDSSGRVLANAKSVTAQKIAMLPVVIDQSGLQPNVGSTVLPTTEVSFIQTVLAQLQAKNIKVRQIVLPAAAFEADIYISGKPYFVKFNMQDTNGALQQAGSFIAVYQYLATKNITPSQYIDVRIDGRVYYK